MEDEHPSLTNVERHEQDLDTQRDESTGHERTIFPSGVETGAHDCGPGRGDPVSTKATGIMRVNHV